MSSSALVFNIQNYSLHDGPGIRTIVFLKGCPLHCKWCCNPESQKYKAEISYVKQKCIGQAECAFCRKVCPQNAIVFGKSGKAEVCWDQCSQCLACADVCPSKAIKREGEHKEIGAILDQVEQQADFYRYGEGGLTVSGGEPLSHGEWLIDLLMEAKERRIHTAIETCGYADYQILREAAKFLDVILFDLKSMNPEKHEKYTGKSNQKILGNFERLCQEFPDLTKQVRTPVIPGFNDTEKELYQIKDFIKDRPGVSYEMLPYHRFGEGKYKALGREYKMSDQTLSDEIINFIKSQKESRRK